MIIYDLSLPISPNMVVWPGQSKPKIEVKTDNDADGISLTKISLMSHHGTHVDAPKHYYKRGTTIDEIAPGKLVGPCKVIDLTGFFQAGGPAEIGRAHFEKHKVRRDDKILIKTGNYRLLKKDRFTSDYISLSRDAAKFLSERKVSLIGIDYLGIEKKGNPGHPVHKLLLKEGVIILEGLNLEKVKGGDYFLLCAPLKLAEADASPARVFLIDRSSI